MKVYNLNEITDSKILYDKKVPRFMLYVVALVVILISLCLLWANKSVKTYVVKGQGIVTTENKAQVMAKVSGAINEVFIEEGKEVKEGEVLVTLNPVESNLQLGQVNDQIAIFNRRIELLQRAEKDAGKGINSFNKNKQEEVEFYNRLVNSYVKRKEYEVNEESLKSQGYTEDQVNQYKIQSKNKLEAMYFDTIIEFTNERKQLELEKSKLETQKAALEKTAEEFKITSPKNGVVHLNTPITKGMVLQGGNLVGSINSKEEELIVETLLPSSERPRIHNNDEVAIVVAGLNQAEYGAIPGKVISIDEDATINQEKGEVFFKVKVKPEKIYLSDKKGEKVNLTAGMITETRVKYEKMTYMKYFIELIGIKFN